MSKPRIIIIEDEQDMAELISMRLKREGYDVEAVHDGLEGLTTVRSHLPDLLLLDLMLPSMSGTQIATELRNDPRTAAVAIIMLTAKSEERDIVVGLYVGADDYITKPFSMSVLVAKVAALLRRSRNTDAGSGGKSLNVGSLSIDLERHLVEVGGKRITLTLTEFRLLVAIVSGRGRVLERNRLIDEAMGLDAVVTDRTIDVHMAALRKKLGTARNYIKTVRGVGYKLADENET